MSMIIVTFFVMLLVVAAMAIGVIVSNKPIQGSCGGMSALGLETACDICGGDQSKCDEEQERLMLLLPPPGKLPSDLAYDATKN